MKSHEGNLSEGWTSRSRITDSQKFCPRFLRAKFH